MADKELSNEEMESYRKELAEIKADMMRQELEEIKKERMRKELEELKRERAANVPPRPPTPVYVPAPAQTKLSLPNLIAVALMLLVAGYLAGTAYGTNVAGSIDNQLTSYSLPAVGPLIVLALAVILAAFGLALMTIARK